MLRKSISIILFTIFVFNHHAFAEQEKPSLLPSQKALFVLGYDIMPVDWDSAIKSEIDFLKKKLKNKNKEETHTNATEKNIKRITNQRLIDIEGRLCVKNDNCLGYYRDNLEKFKNSAAKSQALWEQIDVLVHQAKSDNPYDGFLLEFYDLLYKDNFPLGNFIILGKALTARSSLSYFSNNTDGINQTCDNIAFGKSLMGSNSSHFKKAFGGFFVIGNLNLLNEMLTDSKGSLTKNCQAILQPLPEDVLSFCNTDEELELLVRELKEGQNLPFLYDRSTLMPMLKQQWKNLCTQEMHTSLKNDNPIHPLKKTHFTKLQCARNIIYCRAIADMMSPQNNPKTRLKSQDANAYLRLWFQLIDSDNCQLNKSQWHPQRHLTLNEDGVVSMNMYGFEKSVSVNCPFHKD
ncbi:MAG: hypothetical protein KGV50_07925 [Gammaproteobacteria bacterium]|nr:hypothetical protein [Gammaproteobacteria bacterium]